MIRDIFITVFAGMGIVLMLVAGFLMFRLYRTVKRTAQKVETVSAAVLETILSPLSYLTSLVEAGRKVVEMVQDFRGRGKKEQEEGEPA